jgi:ribosome-binding protein aMBF1 (putative translation factor)
MIEASARPGVSRQRRHQLRHPVRHSARVAVARAIRAGQLQRPDSCSRCKRPCKPDSHHKDYSAPLKVEWLCHSCHLAADRKARRPPFSFKRLAARTVSASKHRAEKIAEWLRKRYRAHTRRTATAGQQLLAAREARSWGQRHMAAYLGVDPAEVSRFENGLRAPTRLQANRMEALLGIPTAAWDDPADLLPQDGSATGEAA